VSWVLVRESKGLLIGKQARGDLARSILALAEKQDGVEGANGVIATNLAPDQIAVTLSLEFSDELRTPQIEEAVRSLEARLREKHPEVVALFAKPQSRPGFKEATRVSECKTAFTNAGQRISLNHQDQAMNNLRAL
jgi:divalent metal cation (Fe/Co/Zn/Cd) transporter